MLKFIATGFSETNAPDEYWDDVIPAEDQSLPSFTFYKGDEPSAIEDDGWVDITITEWSIGAIGRAIADYLMVAHDEVSVVDGFPDGTKIFNLG
jgi:hypothetical protein